MNAVVLSDGQIEALLQTMLAIARGATRDAEEGSLDLAEMAKLLARGELKAAFGPVEPDLSRDPTQRALALATEGAA